MDGELFSTNEVVFLDLSPDPRDRRRSYELVGAAVGLTARR